MRTNRLITIRDSETQVVLTFDSYDGDDCFDEHQIELTTAGGRRTYHFGACAVYGLRKCVQFFRDSSKCEAGLGFQHDGRIKQYDFARTETGYIFKITYDRHELLESVVLTKPVVEIEPILPEISEAGPIL